MFHYRRFRNDDPPRLVEVWNEVCTARGAVRLRNSATLEMCVLAKTYFDPAGLILAFDDKTPIGFVHAGFRANDAETALSHAAGVICFLGVRPAYRGRGVGKELLRRAEEYLATAGSKDLYAGSMHPLNPFYFGIYGGSELPGFLSSDSAIGPFLVKHGYRIEDTCLVYQRLLDQELKVADARFADLRRRCEVIAQPRSRGLSWWQECVLGPIELIEFRLEDKTTRAVLGRTAVWDMDGYSARWKRPTVGIVEMEVPVEQRRHGLGKFLLTQLLRYLQDQFFTMVEVQTMQSNVPGRAFYDGLGFQRVDTGHIYKKE